MGMRLGTSVIVNVLTLAMGMRLGTHDRRRVDARKCVHATAFKNFDFILHRLQPAAERVAKLIANAILETIRRCATVGGARDTGAVERFAQVVVAWPETPFFRYMMTACIVAVLDNVKKAALLAAAPGAKWTHGRSKGKAPCPYCGGATYVCHKQGTNEPYVKCGSEACSKWVAWGDPEPGELPARGGAGSASNGGSGSAAAGAGAGSAPPTPGRGGSASAPASASATGRLRRAGSKARYELPESSSSEEADDSDSD
jgi:hypothetical protein